MSPSTERQRRIALSSGHRLVGAGFSFVALLVLVGCAGTGARTVVKIDLGRPVPTTLHEASDAATFLASVAAAVKDLGLPLSSPVHAYFYPTQAAFEIGLVSDARWSVDLARAAAVSSWGVGTYYGIFLREDKFREI